MGRKDVRCKKIHFAVGCWNYGFWEACSQVDLIDL